MGQQLTISIADIALMYLDAALTHFNNKEYIISLHLAGAADDLLGKILEQRNTSTSLADRVRLISLAYKNHGAEMSDKDIRDKLNFHKNKVKHVDTPVDPMFRTADWENEADHMLLRAITNYEKVFGNPPDTKAFDLYLNNLEIIDGKLKRPG
jgi:hypothetical protein